MKKVVVIGLGYVGAATAIAIANSKKKYLVHGLDQKTKEGIKRINSINNFKFPFETTDIALKKALLKAVKIRKNLVCSFNKILIKNADIVMVNINFDVLSNNGNQRFDLDPFKLAIKDIASRVKFNTLTIINSTVPPGCCEKIILPIFKSQFKKRKIDESKILLAHSYERVMPGKNYYNSIKNFWRVYSGINKKSEQVCKKFLASFINTKKYPLTKLQNTRSSETAKVLENTYRAANIALIEEWTKFSKEIKINLLDVIKAIKIRPTHNNIMQPGIGVGGYCLTKDPKFADLSVKQIFKKKKKIDFKFSNLALVVNKKMSRYSIEVISKALPKNIKNKKLLILGVAYKNDIGDTRNSPVINIYKFLKQKKAIVEYYDPYVPYWDEIKKRSIINTLKIDEFDYFILAVNHSVFKNIDFTNLVSKRKIFFDFANVLSEKKIYNLKKKKHNFYFLGKI